MPGHSELAARFGEDAVLRFVVGLLCVYMVMLVVERQRLEVAFKQLLGAFKDSRRNATKASLAFFAICGRVDSTIASVRKSLMFHRGTLQASSISSA